MRLFRRTGIASYNSPMAFEVSTTDGDIERIDDADSYQLEGPLTTFFLADGHHARLSSWSVRVASLRTDRILAVRRVADHDPSDDLAARRRALSAP
jgi:hypothetical protein